jgi:hypothetical protein
LARHRLPLLTSYAEAALDGRNLKRSERSEGRCEKRKRVVSTVE